MVVAALAKLAVVVLLQLQLLRLLLLAGCLLFALVERILLNVLLVQEIKNNLVW